MPSFNTGLLQYDIEDIIKRRGNPDTLRVPEDPRVFDYIVILHTVDNDYEIHLKEYIDVTKDFNSNISDVITTSFMFPMGDYVHEIYPNRNNLELSIIKVKRNKTSVIRGKFIMTNNQQGLENSAYTKMSQEEANQASKIRIKGQLVIPQVEALRTVIITGIYNYSTVKQCMLAAFKEATNNFKINNLSEDINIDLIEPNNQRTYRHIKLQPNINIFDLPSFLQNTDYGVYNANIGTYFNVFEDKPLLFIYPLYDYTLFNKRKKKVMLYGSYEDKYDNIESTFVVDSDIVKIVASKIKITNMGDSNLIDKGNNIVRTNANILAQPNYNTITNEDYVNDSEPYVIKKQYKQPEDGTLKSIYTDSNDNEYRTKSSMIRANTIFIQVTWRFCEDDMIYPGMPIMFIYEKSDTEVIKYTGQIQGIFYSYDFSVKAMHAMMNIAVQEYKEY